MPKGCGNHTRDGSSCFEEDDSLAKPIGSAHGTSFGIIAYSKPLGRIHGVPAFPQLLEGH